MDNTPKQANDAENNVTEDMNSNIKSLLGSMENYTKSMEKFFGIHKELVDFGEKCLAHDEELAKFHDKNPDMPVWMLPFIKTALAKGGEYPKVVCEFINQYGKVQEEVATMLQFACQPIIKQDNTSEIDFEKLDGAGWADLLRRHPEFADKCDWSKLNGEDWAVLLVWQPQFAGKCDKWTKMSMETWVDLLEERPQFADKCDKWAEITDVEWACLLEKQPQLAKYRPAK